MNDDEKTMTKLCFEVPFVFVINDNNRKLLKLIKYSNIKRRIYFAIFDTLNKSSLQFHFPKKFHYFTIKVRSKAFIV